jgi:hypothetical protein
VVTRGDAKATALSPDARAAWAQASHSCGRDPVVGTITVNFESFPIAGVPGQSLGIAFPTAGGADEQKLKQLKELADKQRPT